MTSLLGAKPAWTLAVRSQSHLSVSPFAPFSAYITSLFGLENCTMPDVFPDTSGSRRCQVDPSSWVVFPASPDRRCSRRFLPLFTDLDELCSAHLAPESHGKPQTTAVHLRPTWPHSQTPAKVCLTASDLLPPRLCAGICTGDL